MDRIKSLIKSEKPLRWVFAGDSITHGVRHTLGYRDYVQIVEERLTGELPRYQDAVIKTGVSGWTTGALRKNLNVHVLDFSPDIVSLMIGMNDCARISITEFEDNYKFILDAILNSGKTNILLHTPNPIIPNCDATRLLLPEFVEKILGIASSYKLPIIDHYAYWLKSWEQNSRRKYSWMSDAIHPNHFGHRAFARLILQELDIWAEETNCIGVRIP